MAETKEAISFPFIEGNDIILCPLNMKNINLYTKWMNSPENRKYARYEFPQTVEEVKKLFEPKEERIKEELFFEIFHKKDKKPIGFTGLLRIFWFDRNAFLFYMIGESEYTERGIATEAGKLVVDYAFKELNLHKVSLHTFSPNKASIRVAEKLGFKHEITLKKEEYIDGEHIDKLKYSILKHEWMNSNEIK